MKTKFLKLNKPCEEKWENMKPNEKGSFCDFCSKNVIDFTQLNQIEISNIIKKSNGEICARLTQKQLSTPFFDTNLSKEYHFPFSNIAAGIIIATTLTASQKIQAETIKFETEYVQQANSELKNESKQSKSKPNDKINTDFKFFKGIVISEENGTPIENAKITFVTVQKIITTYTLKDGSFSLELPAELIDNDNVIRVSYNDVVNEDEKEVPFGYETTDYILSRQEIESEYSIEAKPEVLYLGGIGYYSEDRNPIVISNGQEIRYKAFIKAQQGKKSSCNLENKDFYYFETKSAIAIYGKKAKHGLYLLIDKK